jgi:hypothetical protein
LLQLPPGVNTMTEEHDKRVNDQLTGQASGPAAQPVSEQSNITTGGGDYAERDIDKPRE